MVEYEDSVISWHIVEPDLLNLGVGVLFDAVVAGEVGLLIVEHVLQRLERVLVERQKSPLAAADVLQGDGDCMATEVTFGRARRGESTYLKGAALSSGTLS